MSRDRILAAVVAALLPCSAVANPLALDFMPPPIALEEVCMAPAGTESLTDLGDTAPGTALTDPLRIRFLISDTRRAMRDDADGYFDFIGRLIERRGELDPGFDEIEQIFARIALHERAERFGELRDAGLVQQLHQQADGLNNHQLVRLAQYIRDGIGIDRDRALAQALILEAAYGGHALALLDIARLQIRGELVEEWDAPLDLTVTMAFGGMLGQLDGGICGRAERIAQEYLKGEIVARNPGVALAWRRFAADLGGAEAAWRVVEYHLNAAAPQKDNDELRRYLERAVELGLSFDRATAARIAASGAISPADVERMLGFNHSEDGLDATTSLIPHLELDVNVDGVEPDPDGPREQYLREISEWPEAPGQVFTERARLVMEGHGRWAGEDEARGLLEEAVRRGDPEGMQRLARMLVRYRDDPQMLALAETLLLETVSRHGMASSMERLDALYRCQAPNAPRLGEANVWSANYAATGHATMSVGANDLLALSPFTAPEAIARIQTQGWRNRSQMLAAMGVRLQADPRATQAALQLWADRMDSSPQALEAFAEYEFAAATTPALREQAVEFFRRVHLNNGVTTALDLAVALIEHNGRDPATVAEVHDLLTMAGNRGEGAAIRLMSRLRAEGLLAHEHAASASTVYAEFAQVIEERGDFLALIFAIPFVAPGKVNDYIDRAVSLMNCSTKDVQEVGDAYAYRGDAMMAFRWQQIGLQIRGGNVLSKLRLTDDQMAGFDTGAAPSPRQMALRALDDGDRSALQRLYRLASDPGLPSYDPGAAAAYFKAALSGAAPQELSWLLRNYRRAPDAVREAVSAEVDFVASYRRAAQAGDPEARYEYAMLLRAEGDDPRTLSESVEWLEAAAMDGHHPAMRELAIALGLGLGVEQDIAGALEWLARADDAGLPGSASLAELIGKAHAR